MAKIYVGEQDKIKILNDYIQSNDINKVYIIGEDLPLDYNKEYIKFSDTIMYKYFYRLLQEINKNSLIVLNECLKKQNRYDLTYNCIRRYILQTNHRIIFNYYPIIREEKDFMILYDMLQNNPFLKEKYEYITKFDNVEIGSIEFEVTKDDVNIDLSNEEYEAEKKKLVSEVNKDPDIIPRRLLKFIESKKPKGYDRIDKIKKHMKVAVSQFKVDEYYYNQLLDFKKELDNVVQRIQGR